MVVAREGDEVVKVSLANRFQEAIDEAAMRLGEIDADAYLNGWAKDSWVSAQGTPAEITNRIVALLESEFSESKLATLLNELGS